MIPNLTWKSTETDGWYSHTACKKLNNAQLSRWTIYGKFWVGWWPARHWRYPSWRSRKWSWFIRATLDGEHEKAKFYLLPDTTNLLLLRQQESNYGQLSGKEKNLFRESAIRPVEIKQVNDSVALYKYYNTYRTKDTTTLRIVRVNSDGSVILSHHKNVQLASFFRLLCIHNTKSLMMTVSHPDGVPYGEMRLKLVKQFLRFHNVSLLQIRTDKATACETGQGYLSSFTTVQLRLHSANVG